MQLPIFSYAEIGSVAPFSTQLLKWIGNKQRFANEIVAYFPRDYQTYIEPFLGSGAVLGTLSPRQGIGSDVFGPLAEIWQTLSFSSETLKRWYAERYALISELGDKATAYEQVKASYNANPNGADLLFLCRSCYGGVVRFRKADGYMSTPCGIHAPISPKSFSHRVDIWSQRTQGTEFLNADFEEIMDSARSGDIVYCDPPYTHSQTILYGAQLFDLMRLFRIIERCKTRGVYVALSIDGTKQSGAMQCHIPIPDGLFEREVFVNCGRSMLRRFQLGGKTLESEVVSDRLLLTY
jgi:DNA adenine methylase